MILIYNMELFIKSSSINTFIHIIFFDSSQFCDRNIKSVFMFFYQGITVDDKRIADINALADKLISQGRTDTNAVKEKRNNLNQKYVIFYQLLSISFECCFQKFHSSDLVIWVKTGIVFITNLFYM